MFKRKSKKIIEAVKESPKVVKTFKNYRIIKYQSPLVTDADSKKVLQYTNNFQLQKRNTNALEEPFWQDDTLLFIMPSIVYSSAHDHNLLVEILMDMLEAEGLK